MKFVTEDGRYGYLARVELGEENETWVEILPVRKITHPTYGEIDITRPHIDQMKQNFDAKVRGIDLDINYAHRKDPSKGEQAAAWFKETDIRPASDGKGDALWGRASFTDDAAKEVRDGKWRYISAEFMPKWDDGQGKVHENVLIGAALTNRPFMKGMAPVNFSEMEDYAERELQEMIERGTDEGWLPMSDDFTVFLRDITVKERKGMASSDFAGKGTSFPIAKPEDVASAAALIGRAGASNFSADEIKANIIRIAKRKGAAYVAQLPKSWKMDENEEVSMDKELLKAIGLADDASQEDIDAKVKELAEFRTAHEKPDEKKDRTFAEMFPEEYAERQQDKKEKAELKAAEAVRKLNEKGVPTAVNAKLTALLMGETSIKLSENGTEREEAISVTSVLEDITAKGLVPVGKKRPQGDNDHDEVTFDDPREEVEAGVRKLMEADKDLDYFDARTKFASENQDLVRKAGLVYADKH